ncbi:MAG: NAD(P)/FAD-dependent oxidoreductase [Deltaproteobacteria bacterium]|nr:NAD(P)/FAD-dependent oxidoreductase [Deltaproteobacteria bacterium]
MKQKKAIIIGAGPAGLTAALELLQKSDIRPIILEATNDLGGISKTVNYRGNRIDIGGHRFFSKSKRVTDWWTSLFPIQGSPSLDEVLLNIDTTDKYKSTPGGPDPQQNDRVMLLRNRLSRIYSFGKFFDYPVSLSLKTIINLGPVKLVKVAFSYLCARIFTIKHERSLEDFFINRFGRELYQTFFQDYTEKVWGVPCHEIKPEWGAQRVKGLSITAVLLHALKKIIPKTSSAKNGEHVETSLIEQFMYPKYGPGQLWEEAGKKIEQMGGIIHKNQRVCSISVVGNRIAAVETDSPEGKKRFEGDYFISSMPVKDLLAGMDGAVPEEVRSISDGLIYRDFITVGLLLSDLKIKNPDPAKSVSGIMPDNWVYIQENSVKLGRLQIFNNWSPYMVSDINRIWVGLEYFCNEGDALWSMEDSKLIDFAASELAGIHLIDRESVLDGVAIRIPKAYPAYFGTYDRFDVLRDYLDPYRNLYLIGRNGMHRYNNMDHSMMTAMVAVDNILSGVESKDNIWDVNTEEDYHEA